jgi:ElaB/YqjD/DUF883 family membrane-anchored ribosome-binding protein
MTNLGNNIKSATDAAKNAGKTARSNASAAVDKSKAAASAAVNKGKAAASRGVASSKALAKKAGDTTTHTIEANPLAIVAGGIAIGAIVGMLLPTSKREQKALGKAGKKLNKAAKRASEAAKIAGKDKIDSLGLNQDALRDQFRDLVSKASEAVKAAGKAAAEEARKRD